jgi:hypothetical protein
MPRTTLRPGEMFRHGERAAHEGHRITELERQGTRRRQNIEGNLVLIGPGLVVSSIAVKAFTKRAEKENLAAHRCDWWASL